MTSIPEAPAAHLDGPFSRDARAWWMVAGAAVLLAVRYRAALTSTEPLADEGVYTAAFAQAAQGGDLRAVAGWYYPDVLAHLGAAAGGGLAVLGTLRALNLAGIAVILGFAGALMPRGWGWALLLGLAFTRPVADGIEMGNVSGLLVGLILLAAAWRAARDPMLCLGFLFKPLALAPALSRPWREAALPAACALLAFANTSGRRGLGNLDAASNAAPVRALHELGLPTPWWVVTALALGAALLWARGSWSRAMVLGWLALPLLWCHTSLLLIPPWALGVRRALARPQRERRLLDLALLGLAGVVLAQSRSFGLVEGAAWQSGLLGLVPAGAALLLLALTGDEP